MKLNLKIILALILISLIMVASGYAILSQLDKLADPISNQIPQSIEDLAEKSTKDGYAQLIRYYDEILTQSARNYAFTQDKKWEERYREAEPKLIQIIDKAIDAGDDLEKDFFSQVDKANMALVEMEYAAIDLVNAGKASEAVDILESQEYWDYKNFYLDGLNDYVFNRGMEYEQAIETSTTILDDLSKTTQVLMIDSRNAFLFTFPLILVTLFIVAYLVHKTIINPIKKLKDATISISTGNLDTNIVTKGNDEIHDLSKSFNEMSKYLKKYQEEIIRRTQAEERSLNLEKIEKQKENFISMITHELRTPLTPIIGFAQALSDPTILGTLTPKQQNAVKTISKNAKRLQSIIGDLLDSHRLDLEKMKFNFTEVDVVELINSVINNYKNELESKRIHVTVSAKPPMLLTTDKLRVEQVFTNIFINSIDFVPNNTGEIIVSAKLQKDSILFTIRDNGAGIPPEEIINIFNPFSQIDTALTRKHGGAGLGLAICKALVTKLGGKIWVESELGKGTTFYFTISQKAAQMDKSE